MKASRFLWITLGLSALLLASVAIFNATIDPFQQYRIAATGTAPYPRSLQRYINPGLAKNAQYDFIISGSSMMENFSLREVDRRCGMKSINLATSAISAFEQRMILETGLNHHPVRKVLVTLDFNSFAVAPNKSLPEITDELPTYLYDNNPINDVRYLLSYAVTRESFSKWRGTPGGDADSAWHWNHETTFSRKKMLAGIDSANINKNFKQSPRNLTGMLKSFDANIAALVAKYPKTEFYFVFPPYSIVVWADFAQRKQADISLDFKREVATRLLAFPNAQVFDMQWDSSITHNLDLYTDIYHFQPSINYQMLAIVCGGDSRYRMTETTTPQFIASLRQQIRTINLDELFSQH